LKKTCGESSPLDSTTERIRLSGTVLFYVGYGGGESIN